MGYATHYELTVFKGKDEVRTPCSLCNGEGTYPMTVLEAVVKDERILESTREELQMGISGGTSKWYDHVEDLKTASRFYPDVVFRLAGEGEENDDIWVKYFQNGRVQTARATIKIDDFDPKKFETEDEG